MISILIVLFLSFVIGTPADSGPLSDFTSFSYRPEANPGAMVIPSIPTARFTVLTTQLIRMEYSANGTFEDRATLAFVNRYSAAPPKFTATEKSGMLIITTPDVELFYVVGKEFTASTLWVNSVTNTTGFFGWHYGDRNDGILPGTIRSLDHVPPEQLANLNCTSLNGLLVLNESIHCTFGVISRNGWVVINDSGNYIMDSKLWFSPQLISNSGLDLYLLAHGQQYKQALKDFIMLSGQVPLLPKYTTGVWFTRWFDYDAQDVRNVVEDFIMHDYPLDVFVFDMNWHTKNAWGSYTWDRQLFPDPFDTLDFLHSRGLAVLGNVHDVSGMGHWEATLPQFLQAMGLPSATMSVPFSPLNATYVRSVSDIALVASSFDNFWVDYNGGGGRGGCPDDNLTPTFILNHARSTDKMRRKQNRRDVIMGRYPGLGGQRYPIGNTGDLFRITWDALAYQVWFTVSAANVAFGYWSNDVVGPNTDLELYVRWIQWGAWSPIFRAHDRGLSAGTCTSTGTCDLVRPYNLPEELYLISRAAAHERISLSPYIYTQYRTSYEHGLSILRPMYLEWPDYHGAYLFNPQGNYVQYMFGNDILMAPVVAPMDPGTNVSNVTLWLPPGTWFDSISGEVLNGPAMVTRTADLSEVPTYVKGGAIIPKIPVSIITQAGIVSQQISTLVLEIYPGAEKGATRIYEDDGMTTMYLNGSFSYTTVTYSRNASGITLTVFPPEGSYLGMPSKKVFEIAIKNGLPLVNVTVNGEAIRYKRELGTEADCTSNGAWTYEGPSVTAYVRTPCLSVSNAVTITALYAFPETTVNVTGFRGMFSRSQMAKGVLDQSRVTPGSNSVEPGMLKVAASTGEHISASAQNPWEVLSIFQQYETTFTNAVQEISYLVVGQLTQLRNPETNDTILCATQECIDENYIHVTGWNEGFQPDPSEAGAVPLFTYVCNNLRDNWVTTSAFTPPGCIQADYPNGYVLNTQKPNTLPLQLWYSTELEDHLTVATTHGVQYAQKHGYELVTAVLGYVYVDPSPVLQESPRIRHAQTLMSTVRALVQP